MNQPASGRSHDSPDMSLSGAWHGLEIASAAQQLDVDLSSGLAPQEAASRLAGAGLNRLAGPPPRSPWLLFLSQFKSVLILVLFGAAVLAALIGHVRDASVILAVVVINAFVGFYQEYRAEKSLAALRKMLPLRTYVRRDGNKLDIDAETLVTGDVVLLEAGDRVPADGRLVVAANLDIDESTLTGESQPASKQATALPPHDLPLGDRLNMAYMNTMVTRGRAEMLVTAIGMQTEMGRLSEQLAMTPDLPSPLQVQLDQLGKRLGAVAVTLVGLLFLLQLYRGVGLSHAILDSIALAVAAMPEGLPVVVTVTLALGMHKMAKHRAVVKRLASVETLGCTTVICSDKTGTLTLNQMTARTFFYRGQRFNVAGQGYEAKGAISAESHEAALPDLAALLNPLVACNDSRVEDGRAIGDPTEAALLTLAAKAGFDHEAALAGCPRIAEIPFDSAHKFMATFHREGEKIRVFVKGAPDVLLARCSVFLDTDQEMPLGSALKDRINKEYSALASQGLRGLLIASRLLSADEFAAQPEPSGWVSDLTFIGLIGLMDPPRAEARQAIAECKLAGIAVKMITGDHRDTGMAIARELGLEGAAITGAELDRMDDRQLASAVDGIAVFARVAPRHKVMIVQALQAKGHVVAMTGDGVNDAPALKTADIGIAMGVTGTEVAKEAASMVLTDDNFATIVSAIRQGRALYDNILKFIRFQLSTTAGAILTIFFAPLAGLPEPFNPIQILWVAMIMDGPPAVSLALDAARDGIMGDVPRRRAEPVLPWSRLGRVAAFGLTMMVGTLAVLHHAMNSGNESSALTLAFTTFVLFQFFNVFNARVEHGSTFSAGFFKNRMLWGSLVAVLGLQALAVHWPPAQSIFGTTALSAAQWAIAIGVASSVLILEEGRKALVRLFSRDSRG
ncbi:MAG: putative cation transport ATPase [Polaromonas sp.]|nr:putative cation transport ATPase [Polaromonas sp.]